MSTSTCEVGTRNTARSTSALEFRVRRPYPYPNTYPERFRPISADKLGSKVRENSASSDVGRRKKNGRKEHCTPHLAFQAVLWHPPSAGFQASIPRIVHWCPSPFTGEGVK